MSKDYTIIMVDDEAGIKDIFSFFVEKFQEKSSVNIDFKFFQDPRACLDFFTESHEKIASEKVFVISDINMPDTNGIDFMKEVISKYPFINPIFCTAYSSASFQKVCYEMGAFDFYSKPIDYEILLRKIIEMDGITSSVA